LGESAGARVLSGQTRRGDAETIRAVLVMADMRESTPLAEKNGRASFVETLNEFFEAIAAPFNEDGGEILSFIGDGFLAVYPCERHAEPSQRAAKAAMAATQRAIGRMAELNRSRAEEGLEPISFGIGLH
ncbi:adenylate/guanylate cyclase domain-containing protein, partial [Thioclava sp. BHET1]